MKRWKICDNLVVLSAVFAAALMLSHPAQATDVDDDVHKLENVVCDALSELNPIIKAICSLVVHHGAMQLAVLADHNGDGKPDGDPAVIAELDAMGKKLRELADAEADRIMHGLDGPAHKALNWLHKHSPFGHHHNHAAPPAGS